MRKYKYWCKPFTVCTTNNLHVPTRCWRHKYVCSIQCESKKIPSPQRTWHFIIFCHKRLRICIDFLHTY